MDAITAPLESEEEAARERVRRTMLSLGARIGDRYVLRHKIARGGMSTVWEAEDTSLGRMVAIKFMSPEYVADPEFRARFEEEARAAARLQTPFVARIHDHGVAEGIPYIVMERLTG
jgi:serine/threonine-protein kinase